MSELTRYLINFASCVLTEIWINRNLDSETFIGKSMLIFWNSWCYFQAEWACIRIGSIVLECEGFIEICGM